MSEKLSWLVAISENQSTLKSNGVGERKGSETMTYVIEYGLEPNMATFDIRIDRLSLERVLEYHDIPVSPQNIRGLLRYLEADFGMWIDYMVGEPVDVDLERLAEYIDREGGSMNG